MPKARYFIFFMIVTVIVVASVVILNNRSIEETVDPARIVRDPVEDVEGASPAAVEETATPAQIAPNLVEDAGEAAAAQDAQLAQDIVDDISGSDSERSSEPDMELSGKPVQKAGTLPTAGAHLPLMIRWSNWQPEFGPAIVYARERDLDGMLSMQGPVEKMLMVTSYDEIERLMTRADELRAAGLTIIGLNTEEGPEITPHEEMDTLDSPDPSVNVVARVAQLVTQNGFDVIWGPVRNNADLVSDNALRIMMDAGMRGVALQEQKFIEVQPAQFRLAEVNRTRSRYLRLAQEQGVDDFTVHVQIMPQRCPDMNNCADFVVGLEDIPVDSIAIWSNGPIPLSFISAIRHY